MDTKRAQILLDRIQAAVGRSFDDLPPVSRMHELVARALVEPMTITPPEVQELARAVLLHFPVADPVPLARSI